MGMNKNEAEIARLAIGAEKFGSVVNLLQHAITAAVVLGSVYIIIQGLEHIVLSSPESLGALATVIEKLHINAILGYVVAGCTSLGWIYERTGKKRAIRNSAVIRTDRELQDPYKGSSNLDEDGHTPK
jgi:hypothetical protein